MSTTIDLGKLRFQYKNAYASATVYEYNDVVKYGGDVYVYINVTASSGNAPTDTTYWSPMVSGLSSLGGWSSATTYQVNDVVTHGGAIYRCTSASTNNEPPNSTYWEVFLRGYNHLGTWSSATAYKVDDSVDWGGAVYRCTALSTNNEPPNTTYWAVVVRGYNHRGAWATSTAYNVDDSVTYAGQSYRCVTDHTSGTFFADFVTSSNWARSASGINDRGAYATSTAYYIGDLSHVGSVPNRDIYMCTADHTSDSSADPSASPESSSWTIWINGQMVGSNAITAYAYFSGLSG